MAEALIEPGRDGAILHFLKELPVWCVLVLLISIFLTVWQFSHDDFIPRIIDGLVGGVLTSLMTNRGKSSTAPTVSADTINTGDVLPDKKGDME